ncbi:hypothetical protein CTheo_5886 [Ceratobasidium theobromae]|uniref:Uncharacterized protein n=1 Tax=Ceratobasidium theobromae TaxID=1582974 RepID=A0A5N5QFX6_9AGAM|nr:hypothetical protein CTheo_5886 [Ceratobasidium theobromae]
MDLINSRHRTDISAFNISEKPIGNKIILFLLALLVVLSANGQSNLAMTFRGTILPMVYECEAIYVDYTGGTPPYTFYVWSYYNQETSPLFSAGASGTVIWTVKYDPNALVYMYIQDSQGFYVRSPAFRVQAPANSTGNDDCRDDSVPLFRSGNDLSPLPTTSRPDSSASSTSNRLQASPTTSSSSAINFSNVTSVISTAAPSQSTSSASSGPTALPNTHDLPPPVPVEFSDCRPSGLGTCKFTANGTSQFYNQVALVGDIFANCYSKQNVSQIIGGSTTITDNWSKTVGTMISLPFNNVIVQSTVSHSEAVSMHQEYSWDILPGQQSALIGIAIFKGIFGTMEISYKSGRNVTIENVIYFRATGEPSRYSRMDVLCNETWPVFNATARIEPYHRAAARPAIDCPHSWILAILSAIMATLVLH